MRQIVDIPKLFSLIQLFGYGSNFEIIRIHIQEFISSNSDNFKRDLALACEDITQLLSRYIESDDDNFGLGDDRLIELYNLVANVTDIFFSLKKLAFIDAKLCSVYVDCSLPEAMIAFYSKYFPFIESKCEQLYKKEKIVEK